MRPTYSTCGEMKTVDLITECRFGDKTAAFKSAVHMVSGCVQERNVISFTYGLFNDAISFPYCRDYDHT